MSDKQKQPLPKDESNKAKGMEQQMHQSDKFRRGIDPRKSTARAAIACPTRAASTNNPGRGAPVLALLPKASSGGGHGRERTHARGLRR
jgi:hypothetical protein